LSIIERIFTHLYPQKSNPVRGLRLQRGTRQSIPEPLREAVLEGVLASWEVPNHQAIQDRLLLDLIHHQALRSGELAALKVEHLTLEQGILTIPSCSRSVARDLLLYPHQIPLFQVHLRETRPALGGKREELGCLFSSGGKDAYLMNSLQRLSNQVRSIFEELGYTFKNLEHWRSSRIVQLLERLPLLEVQALIGHKYASSTERYQLQGIEQLSEALRWHHPMGEKRE